MGDRDNTCLAIDVFACEGRDLVRLFMTYDNDGINEVHWPSYRTGHIPETYNTATAAAT